VPIISLFFLDVYGLKPFWNIRLKQAKSSCDVDDVTGMQNNNLGNKKKFKGSKITLSYHWGDTAAHC